MKRLLAVCPVVGLLAVVLTAGAQMRAQGRTSDRRPEPAARALPSAAASPRTTVAVAGVAKAIPAPTESPAARPPSPASAPQGRYDELPGCGNTPEGAFGRAKLGLLTQDTELLRDATRGLNDRQLQELKAEPRLLCVELAGCEVEGETATLHIQVPNERTEDVKAVREEGRWKLDLGAVWSAAEARDCTNNLRQIGTYIVMWVSKYGNDRTYPGPGLKLFSDLFTQPTRETALLQQGSEGLILCRTSGETTSLEAIASQDPSCSSYEVTPDILSDGVTPPNMPIAWDKRPVHGGRRNVLFFSGSVVAMTEEEFQDARLRGR